MSSSASFAVLTSSTCTYLLMYKHRIQLLPGKRRWRILTQYFKYAFCLARQIFITVFSTLSQILIDLSDDTEFMKNWGFPKIHLQTHAFEDVIAKGATRNYNTKPNEKLHGPLRDIYHERTNFRDVAKQVRE